MQLAPALPLWLGQALSYGAIYLIAAVFGAVFLRVACALYNALAGGANSSHGVPPPAWGWALLIVYVHLLLAGVMAWGTPLALDVLVALGAVDPDHAEALEWLNLVLMPPVAYAILTVLLLLLLPTSPLRAFLVALLYLLVAVCFSLLIRFAMTAAGIGTGVFPR